MRIIYADGESEREMELRVGRPNATLADLAAALDVPATGLVIDGRTAPPETELSESGLAQGSRVARAGWGSVGGPRTAAAVLRVVGGLEAGRAFPLKVGRTVIGRGAEADVRVVATGVSRMHAALEISADGQAHITDLGSANGTDVGGERISKTVRVQPEDLISLGGEVLLRVLPPDRLGPVQRVNALREVGPGGTLPFNRAPRGGRPADPPRIAVPTAPRRADKAPFSVSSMLGPLVMAAGIVALTHDFRYAAIAALTPLMFLGNFFEERLRGRFTLRRGMRAHATRVAEFEREVAARNAAEVRTRRAAHPDPAEVIHRATAPGVALWERRPGAPDFLRTVVGHADLPWTPPLDNGTAEPAPEATAILGARSILPQVPVVVGIAAGEAAGFEGDRRACLAVARSLLCQAVVGSGPADVTLAVFADPDRLADWEWTKWLPHGADMRTGTTRLVAIGPEQADTLAKSLLESTSERKPGEDRPGPVLLVVVDGATLLEGRPCKLRELLASRSGGPVECGGIILTSRLPALCTTVITASAEGIGSVRDVASGEVVRDVLLGGMPTAEARAVARALARFEDPELRVEGAGLPDRVSLLSLLDLESVTGPAVGDQWKKRLPALRISAILGVSERDLFTVDLDHDGPHALIAGTTGSGKSELLRTLIASMAIDADPEHLTFAMVDYKGGGALDEFAELPHNVGLVTDLDAQLSERALRCLEAEVHHRERLLRQVGLSHIRDYQRMRDSGNGGLEPMPRLAVVIDEFATLVKALPDFVDALVSIAQRGRSLGVHLILATQDPASSVSDAIKNNIKLRIALRLESTAASHDVIDNPAAFGIGTRQWGRAYYRLSAREVLPVQTALSTGVTPQAEVTAPVTVAPFLLGADLGEPVATGEDGESDLRRLVRAAREGAGLSGFAPPRRPWPDPLPTVLPTAELPEVAERGLHTEAAGMPAWALADDPERQRQYAVGWDPAAGNVLIYGVGGSGTSTALASLALSVAGAAPPDRLHIFALDMGAGDLAPLSDLPHTGAHIGAAERERQVRLIKLLRRELDARKAHGPGDFPQWLVLLDNLGALLSDFDKDFAGMNLIEELARVYADGPAVSIRFAVTADRSGAVPSAWAALTQTKLLMRLADSGEYGYFDIPRGSVPTYVPGRALVAANHQEIQLGWPGEDLAGAVAGVAARWPDAPAGAPRIGLLPKEIDLAALKAPVQVASDPWQLPVGLDDATLECAWLRLYDNEHALIVGPQRSGRSTALCSIAALVAAADTPPAIVAYAPRRSPLRDLPPGGEVAVVTAYAELEETLSGCFGPTLLLVDDADTVEDELSVLERWLSAAATSGSHLIAAGRADGLRRLYGHWTQPARDSRCGVLLAPDHDLDGDLLGASLPRHDRMAPLPGRGYLVVDGVAGGVQLARSTG
ncbi:FtsK/SpoIIIE domain-containing protein [Streptomyces javensis]|uniref:FHA domain-containing protein n=1 Tax=Streptomyces javensis TaxID=114698 RepID=A0ABS0R839_9ACTN|nr:FtsK/SpoIIIE domain-containing protein [Streptomyces javensis]MBI0313571.1 FHA domain-containing protein [Streptomyces javensis]